MRTNSPSATATKAIAFTEQLQSHFVQQLETLTQEVGQPTAFSPIEWLRNEGVNGGGNRYQAAANGAFNRASVNYSHIHYSADSGKHYLSATALSTIIHPVKPTAPSIHMHISLTEMADGRGLWRVMADLNPSHANEEDKAQFIHTLQQAAGDHYPSAAKLGDTYFFIPALKRHRGVAHYYMEGFVPQTSEDEELPHRVGYSVVETYIGILKKHLQDKSATSAEQKQTQLDYHTLYLYQVLTLDKGTTAGLLVHNQNDVGTMGSLPSHINRKLLASWRDNAGSPTDKLVDGLLNAIPEGDVVAINEKEKQALAQAVRTHYQQYPLKN